jgi:nickel-dependent lactate racemase
MKEILFDLGRSKFPVQVPDEADVLQMGKAPLITNPENKIRQALRSPIKSLPLAEIVRKKLQSNPRARAAIVISDNTRPVPYAGQSGILFPVVNEMLAAGLPSSRIRLIVATGTHRAIEMRELREMIDPRVMALDLTTIIHDSRNPDDLKSVGRTEYGGEIHINRYYLESDIKILTGLVESHFMAGASGGRKSICPGLMSEASTYALHSGPILHSPLARDLVLEGNPVHEESLRVARMAGCDAIVNVTLDSDYRLTGVFAGDLEQAHREAVKKLKTYAAIPTEKTYHMVITHAGFVGVNHYQAAKGALVCVPLIKNNGLCLLAAHHTDKNPLGRTNYKKMMRLLGNVGWKKFQHMILDPAWTFVPDQWEAQMWTRLFSKIPPKNLLYCSQEIPEKDFTWLPGTDARSLAGNAVNLQMLVEKTIACSAKKLTKRLGIPPQIAVLPDGPYGIPIPGVKTQT